MSCMQLLGVLNSGIALTGGLQVIVSSMKDNQIGLV